MSIMALVIELVEERGQATVDDLMPAIEGYTRRQVLDALKNAAYRKRLVCITGRRGAGRREGGIPGIYQYVEQEKQDEPPVRRVNSVWQLGAM